MRAVYRTGWRSFKGGEGGEGGEKLRILAVSARRKFSRADDKGGGGGGGCPVCRTPKCMYVLFVRTFVCGTLDQHHDDYYYLVRHWAAYQSCQGVRQAMTEARGTVIPTEGAGFGGGRKDAREMLRPLCVWQGLMRLVNIICAGCACHP